MASRVSKEPIDDGPYRNRNARTLGDWQAASKFVSRDGGGVWYLGFRLSCQMPRSDRKSSLAGKLAN